MAKVKKTGIAVIAAVLVVAVGGYFAWGKIERDKARAASAANAQQGVPVTVGVAETKDVPVFVRGIGTVQAYKTVTVKSRVDGHIVKVLFEEGQEVKKGDPLFQIDPRPYQATLDQAMANRKKDEAQLQGAQLDLERYGKLLAPGFQSRQSYDQQQAAVDALKGSIDADKAAIDTARLNLGYADIRSPIFVNFTVPQDQTDKIRSNQKKEALTVQAYASDDKTLLADGKVTLIDNQIDQATGTLRLKATFENGDERLWPGEFVNARLVLDTRKDAITVPQRVVLQGADGYYLYVVKSDNTVERRDVAVAVTQDGIAVIGKGLAAGEKVVVDGQYRLSNGAHIRVDSKPDQQTPQQPRQQPQQPKEPAQPGTAVNPGAPEKHG